jgi:D-alanine-D-alanine ligase
MKIGVLMGGISTERDISLLSGQQIVENLDRNKYEVFPIEINSKDEVIDKVKGLDFCFIALHGQFGEDGCVQALLESISMPYSGCNVLSSALCMDKKQTKRILKAEGVNVAKGCCLQLNKEINYEELEKIGFPLIVKPNSGGSSVATFKVTTKAELEVAISEAFKYDQYVLVEECLNGSEYTVPILNGKLLPILSINPKGEFFDYKSKYTTGEAIEEVANLPQPLEDKIKAISEKCWDIFDCKSYVRVDFMLNNNEPYVLELNTLPGMTKNSLFPKSASAIGMAYPTLLDYIISGNY